MKRSDSGSLLTSGELGKGLDAAHRFHRPLFPVVSELVGRQALCRRGGWRLARIRSMRFKIVLVGKYTVGKTSLLERYLQDRFAQAYTGTSVGVWIPSSSRSASKRRELSSSRRPSST